MTEIPLPLDIPLFTQTVTLEGKDLSMRFDYNGREDRWYLDVRDEDGELVVGAVKVRCGQDLLAKARARAVLEGYVLALDLAATDTNPGAPPAFADLGRRVRLFYLTASELP